MNRETFEANLLKSQEEANKMDKRRDEILVNKAAEEAELAEIEGKPGTISESVEQNERFEIWRKVKLGTGLKTVADFEKALKAAGREIDSDAGRALKDVENEIKESAYQEEREIELVDATPAELGLPEGGTLEQIYEAAKKNGLEECPREAGPQSVIQYEDQPKDDYRLIGMNPVVDSDGYRHLFSVRRLSGGRRWLDTGYDKPGFVWLPGRRFVFVRRKKSELNS